VQFLHELVQFRSGTSGAWLLSGDFNMIHRASDMSNGRLDRRGMRRFRTFINQAQLDEIQLVGRAFTWTNARDQPTLELLDQMFVTQEWLTRFPAHFLRPLSSDCSDHCPILLQVVDGVNAKCQFRFKPYWASVPRFLEVVASAWGNSLVDANHCRQLDFKLRNTAKALTKWSNERIGSVRLQLAVARVVILRFDVEEEHRQLQQWELELRRKLKFWVLGLASLARTIARQRSRALYLKEGDANTRFFHL